MDLVIGMGEVGSALADILSMTRSVARKDVQAANPDWRWIETMHVCFPYSDEYVAQAQAYIKMYDPDLTIIHSTVPPGTTRAIGEATPEHPVAYSPVRGRHTQMVRDLMRYTKFVSAPTLQAEHEACRILAGAGFQMEIMLPCEALELAKLLETTYEAALIAWAQEMDRCCRATGGELAEVSRFFIEIDYLPDHFFYPGYIGGHCLMPNLALLNHVRPGFFTEAIRLSNDACGDETKSSTRRHCPIPLCEVKP